MRPHFVYHQTMIDRGKRGGVPSIAAAIGEPARARMLYCLLDGRARTATELAVVADVSPSTASVHLQRLRAERLVSVVAQGKHRYYSLGGPTVAAALEALSVLAGGERTTFKPTAPDHLRRARTCYDHIAGAVGVALHDRFAALKWLTPVPDSRDGYDLVPAGAARLTALGVEIAAARVSRRRFAFACLDWSERRPHLGGSLGAAILALALRKRWMTQELDSRALTVTATGRRELQKHLGIDVV
jgi:DNA-binding transcriptional ArsR family regulator